MSKIHILSESVLRGDSKARTSNEGRGLFLPNSYEWDRSPTHLMTSFV